MRNLRVLYQKKGRVKYISHLDVVRCMQRAIKRAKLPVWYTEGFNPHMYLTFALPLSLGYESEYETMDFRLLEPMADDAVCQQLNAHLPEGLTVLRVAEQGKKPEEIASAEYRIRLYADDMDLLSERLIAFMDLPVIEVSKKTKKGFKTVDLKAEIVEYKVQNRGYAVVLSLVLPAGVGQGVNPSLLVNAFEQYNTQHTRQISVLRKNVKCADGSLFL